MTLARALPPLGLLLAAVVSALYLAELSRRADAALAARDSAFATSSRQLIRVLTPNGVLYQFDRGVPSDLLGPGWSDSERDVGTWSRGTEASVVLDDLPKDRPVRLKFGLLPFTAPGHPEQRVEVRSDGRLLARWRLTGSERRTLVLDAPPALQSPPGRLRLVFSLPDASPPARWVAGSQDRRALALNLKTLEVDGVPR